MSAAGAEDTGTAASRAEPGRNAETRPRPERIGGDPAPGKRHPHGFQAEGRLTVPPAVIRARRMGPSQGIGNLSRPDTGAAIADGRDGDDGGGVRARRAPGGADGRARTRPVRRA